MKKATKKKGESNSDEVNRATKESERKCLVTRPNSLFWIDTFLFFISLYDGYGRDGSRQVTPAWKNRIILSRQMKPEAAPSCRRSRTDPMNWNLNLDLNLKEEEEENLLPFREIEKQSAQSCF